MLRAVLWSNSKGTTNQGWTNQQSTIIFPVLKILIKSYKNVNVNFTGYSEPFVAGIIRHVLNGVQILSFLVFKFDTPYNMSPNCTKLGQNVSYFQDLLSQIKLLM